MKSFLTGLVILGGCFVLPAAVQAETSPRAYYFGSDLSYVNEMEDCGAVYRDKSGAPTDIYGLFAETGTNLIRIRLWNDPHWTDYSHLTDVKRALRRAKAAGLPVLLDFHYSDDWADGEKQLVPKAWAGLSDDQQAEALYKFTYDTLMELHAEGLMPDQVQVGNETNGEMMGDLTYSEGQAKKPINWERNAKLFKAGIKGVQDAGKAAGKMPRIMLHIAQPENVEHWFLEATRHGVDGYDLIGISYYRKWSKMDLTGLAAVMNRVRHTYPDKDIVVVETAYPFTDDHNDQSGNLLGSDSAFAPYDVTPEGQARYMKDLMQLTLDNGGVGVVYWEPAWVSTPCKTRWGTGSNWENATFFDFDGKPLPVLDWPTADYVYPVELTFVVAGEGQEALYITGDFTGGLAVPMQKRGSDFVYSSWLKPEASIVVGVAPKPEALGDAEASEIIVPKTSARVRLSVAQ